MTISEMLSNKGLSAIREADEIGRDMLKGNYYSSTVKKLLKNGFWAEFEGKDGTIVKVSVKKNGKETIITRRG